MTLKQFNADLAAAVSKVKAKHFDRIISLRKGESDGELSITYENENLKTPLRIQVLIPNISEYPKKASFLIFTENEDIPAALAATLARLQDQSTGLDVDAMIITLSRSLTRDLQTGGPASDDVASDTEEDYNYGSDDDDYDEDDGDDLFGIHQDDPGDLDAQAEKLHPRLKQDLRTAREHGYKVGIIQSAPTNNIVSISVRASKFKLPEGTLEVWGIRPEEYVVLLIHQTGPYLTLEDIVHPKPYPERRAQFRIGKCAHYKPSFLEALRAFHSPTDDNSTASGANEGEAKLKKIFISNSLDQFLAEGLLNLIKIRDIEGISWDQANEVLLNFQIGTDTAHTNVTTTPCKTDPAFAGTETPQRFRHDHLGDEKDGQRSWPLVAMQFAMRYLLACTRYCLRCHRRVQGDIETLKPYVCSNPLCLFQYLSMGLGPSAEHEIRSQPKVVDLLVSFCYTGLTANRSAANPVSCGIREFPVGLHLRVPDIRPKPEGPFLEGTITDDFQTFKFQVAAEHLDRFIPKQWVAIRLNTPPGELGPLTPVLTPVPTPVPGKEPTHRAEAGDLVHCQIESIDYLNQRIHLEPGIDTGSWSSPRADAHKAAKGQACLLPYVQEFDQLGQGAKRLMMAHLLATLPSISDIKKFLDQNPLSKVKDMPRISPAAMSLLNWIIASNRSCIFETGNPELPGNNSSAPASGGIIPGMEGWVQFRFLQGSPDKESLFQNARESVRRSKHLTCPSIFAWHGSALPNWHSIVRTGLDYAETHNGRAYGHGVYFSSVFGTSLSYTRSSQPSFGIWPNSDLRIVAAISLNEIVNSPGDFVSTNPHLVVSQPNWHMCRFLFVKSEETPEEKAAQKNPPEGHQYSQPYSNYASHPGNAGNTKYLQQDPSRTAIDPFGHPLNIPLAALPSYHHEKSQTSPEVIDVSDNSSDEHDSDTELLASEDDESPPSLSTDTSKTDFRPGTLDLGSLPRLQPPQWSSQLGLKKITFQVNQLQNLQSRTPLHELGWYIDFDQLDNMYQWIVELHSFDPSLPLAADLKMAGLTSVVCEIRFGEQYPYTPPFVRVIRPRFLPFMQGGGGHVTAGGAMCMELLTNSGWTPISSIESVLLQVRMAIMSTDPKPARLDKSAMSGARTDYGIREAVNAYTRSARTHGWTVPEDIEKMVTGFSAARSGA